MISILLSYSLICAAKSVDEIKKDSENTRESLLEDNLIVWRVFPFKVVQSFPDFIRYLKEICIHRNYEAFKE